MTVFILILTRKLGFWEAIINNANCWKIIGEDCVKTKIAETHSWTFPCPAAWGSPCSLESSVDEIARTSAKEYLDICIWEYVWWFETWRLGGKTGRRRHIVRRLRECRFFLIWIYDESAKFWTECGWEITWGLWWRARRWTLLWRTLYHTRPPQWQLVTRLLWYFPQSYTRISDTKL